jgi:hypothetical protein
MIRIGTSLVITGDGLPFDEITEVLGVQPTEVRRREDFYNPEFGADYWWYEVSDVYPLPFPVSGADDMTDDRPPYPGVETQLHQIREAVGDGAERFARWKQNHEVDICLLMGIHSEDDAIPFLEIPPEIVVFAATLGAAFAYDLYLNEGSTFS